MSGNLLKNVIAFSLYGTIPKYCVGAIRNAELRESFYPDWVIRVYHDQTVPKDVLDKLRSLDVELVDCTGVHNNGMMWRMLVANDPEVGCFMIRDADSRFNSRCAMAVKEWMKTDLDFHVMRDHPHHTMPITGGAFGAKSNAVPDVKKTWGEVGTVYNSDQAWLRNHVWPLVRDKCLQHDSCSRHLYPDAFPFPTGCKYGDWRFVGEVFDENDQPRDFDWQMRINFME